MTFILRWPSILVLLGLSLLSIVGALAAAGLITGYEAPIAQVREAQASAAETGAAEATWIDVGLLAGAGVFFLISAIRLIRRTQGFWTWLLGFACYGGRWAMAQEGDLLAMARSVDPNAYLQPQVLVADLTTPEAQIGLLGLILIVGLLVFIVDAADRAYWDRQGG
jgi:hypothetical protein